MVGEEGQIVKQAQDSSLRRETAIHVRISDILQGSYTKKEGWEPNTIDLGSFHFSRVSVMGVIVSAGAKGEGVASSVLTLDDGSGHIALRSFDGRPARADVGDLVLVVGRPREFGGERYLMPEIVRKLDDARWIEVRKLELQMLDKERSVQKTAITASSDAESKSVTSAVEEGSLVIDEEVVVNDASSRVSAGNSVERLLGFIRSNDSGTGVAFEAISAGCPEDDVDVILRRLLESGDVFELRPGHYKVLE